MKPLMIALAVVLVIAPASLWAQNVPKSEFFGGFGLVNVDKETLPGFQVNAARNVSSHFGIVADLMGAYGTYSFHNFSGGLRFNYRANKATVFGQALLGGLSYRGIGDDDLHLTMQYGAGVDVRATDKFSIRIIEFNWRPAHVTDGEGWYSITSYGIGVVFKTGSP